MATRDEIATIVQFADYLSEGEFRPGGKIEQFCEEYGYGPVELGGIISSLADEVGAEGGWGPGDCDWN